MDINTRSTIQQLLMQPVRYLGRNVAVKKRWVTRDVLGLCNKRRDLKKRYEAEGAKEYREVNYRIQKAVKNQNETYRYSVRGD